MTTKPTDPMTHAERCLWLAELKGPCPCSPATAKTLCDRCGAGYPGECWFCHGTGQVVRFPMLRVPCRGEIIERRGTTIACGRSCVVCEGRGWVPVLTTDALLEAGKPYQLGVWWMKSRGVYFASTILGENRTEEATPAEALARALVVAEKARQAGGGRGA